MFNFLLFLKPVVFATANSLDKRDFKILNEQDCAEFLLSFDKKKHLTRLKRRPTYSKGNFNMKNWMFKFMGMIYSHL